MPDVPIVKVIQFYMMEIVLLIVQLDQIIMEKHVLLVLLHKDGTELNVLIDAILVEFGTPAHQLVFVQQVNSGTDMLASSVQMEEHGMLILKPVNAQSQLHGTELLVLLVLEEEFIIMSPINANAQVDKLTMDMFVLLTAQLVNSIMKQLKDVFAQVDKIGMVIFVFIAMVVKPGILH